MLAKALLGAAKSAVVDAYYNLVTLLLPGNGTNGAQNNTFLDSSTNNFTITRNGNTTQGTFSPYGDNWSNYFVRASSSYITFADNSAFNLSNSNFTIECFIFCTLSGSTQDIAGQADSSITTTSRSFLFQINGSGNIVAGVWSGTTGYTVTSSSTFAFNAWHHVALVRDGSTITLYVNGASQGTSNISTASVNDSSNNLSIGRFGERNTAYYDGYVSNFRMVVGTAVYTAAFTPPTAPLTAITNTSLLTCQSNRFIDNSTNAFAITVNGDVSVQRFSPFSPTAAYASGTIGGSGYFDGTGDYLVTPSSSAFAFGTGDYTVECWLYPLAIQDQRAIFDIGVATWQIYNNVSGQLLFYNGADRITSSAIVNNSWYHIAITRQSNTTKLFINGTQSGSSYTDTSNYSTNNAFAIADRTDGGLSELKAYISDVRVVKGTAVYTANFTPPTAPVTNITNTSLLCNFTNAGIIDNAMMNDLETVGNAQISTSVSKFGGGSMYFDGSGDYLTSNVSASELYAFGSSDFTIECWIYLNTTAGLQIIYDGRPATAQTTQPTLFHSGGTIAYYTNGANRIVGSALSTSTWYHIALARSGTSTKLFVDGTQVGSTYTDSTVYTNTSGRPWIGADSYSIGNNLLNGYIDDLRVTKGYARYTANFTAPTAPFALQ